MTEENHEKTPVRLVGSGIRTRDLPNTSLVRYHGATSLGMSTYDRAYISWNFYRKVLNVLDIKFNLEYLGNQYINWNEIQHALYFQIVEYLEL